MSTELKRVSVFLIKEEIDDIDDIIKFNDDNPKKIALLPEVGSEDGAFYLGKSKQKEPEWLEFLNQLAVEKQEISLNTTNSAVLVLRVMERNFAFCFGYGRFFLNTDTIERQFGLKVALNMINPNELRTLDYKKYEEVVISTKRQVSRGSALNTFEIDINSEMLRNIGGKVKESEELGNSVYGSDSVALNLKKSAGKNNIVQICSDLLNLYNSSDYKENFDFIDYLMPVIEPMVVEQLDKRLLGAVKNKKISDFHMAPPEIFNYEESEGFGFSTLPEEEAPKDQLDPLDYINSIKKLNKLTVNQLKQHQVRAKSSTSSDWQDRWPVYNCFVFETECGDDYYVLHEGAWFHVEKDFARQLNKEIETLAKQADIKLPTIPNILDKEVIKRFKEKERKSLKITHEKYFNEYVGCKTDDKVTLDRRNIYPSGGKTPIEFCDIITTRGQMVHVKPGTSSAHLSHLFKQGTVSAELFVSDPLLREKVIKIIEEDPRLQHWSRNDQKKEYALKKRKELAKLISENKENVDRNKFEVVYCIIANITDQQWPAKIPFFSKVSLRKEKRAIERLGLKVSLTKVSPPQKK